MERPELTKKQAGQILKSRIPVTTADKYKATVTNVTPFIREETNQQTFIVNLAAMTSYHIAEAKKAWDAGDYTEAANFNMSASLLPGQYIPTKGEVVDIEVGNYINKEGINTLVVNKVIKRQVVNVANITGFDFEDEKESNKTEKVEKVAKEEELA